MVPYRYWTIRQHGDDMIRVGTGVKGDRGVIGPAGAIEIFGYYADNTARDAYFSANPSDLIDLRMIAVGTGYQIYDAPTWRATNPLFVVRETTLLLSSITDPTTDIDVYTGYLTVIKTNSDAGALGLTSIRMIDGLTAYDIFGQRESVRLYSENITAPWHIV